LINSQPGYLLPGAIPAFAGTAVIEIGETGKSVGAEEWIRLVFEVDKYRWHRVYGQKGTACLCRCEIRRIWLSDWLEIRHIGGIGLFRQPAI